MLKTLLTKDVIQLIPNIKDWREAIAVACQPLVENSAISPRYIDAIYRSHEEIGPYYVVGPGIAMPHARPEEGVNRLSLALTVVSQGVEFGSEGNDPVKLLIVLAAIDNASHIEVISQLAALFDNQQDTKLLMGAKSKEEIISVIDRY
ncbi:PTS sugar transporter subunit IIA [Photorhabdus heterorhabditis]|uniref:PTS mannitol transporter subunit IIA n=1 Tax=Photorhabdus heterorhabditis TaxID=880156 RepID=A0A5B0W2S5_9GAMM|nr:PTS sugar transporter subunit IIA [Photorhabdus heterorhabditis]KAA1181303.1 PTS sugar transporter subunit IIA [Photorhabdus heterorhabditis]KOY60296.1 PTS mannitol transporter subunit IIA [Photorhabdus heterorhabditis]MBS9444037.1 PTS sugar transporter subunit IIA [Photorhabdus heterorhabditis]